MRIRHKIIFGYVALVSVAVALVVYFLVTLSDINTRYRDVITRDLNILEEANNIRSAIQRQIVAARTFEQILDDSLRLEYSVAVTDARAALNDIKPFLTGPDDLRTIEQVQRAHNNYSDLAQDSMTLAAQMRGAGSGGEVEDMTAITLKRVQGETARIELTTALETFIARKNTQVAEAQAALNAKVEETSTFMLLWSMLGVIVTAIAGALLVESISAPIRRLMRNIQGISRGDLHTAVAVRSRDEIGELAGVLETMRQRLAHTAAQNEQLLQSAREEADKLAEARHNLQVANRELQAALVTESEARKRMVEIDKLKAEFTSMVSHELKTPVSYIYNYAGALKEHHAGLNEGQRMEFLTAVQGEAQHLITLIDDIMAISLLEAGGLVHRFVETDLRKIIDSVVHDQSLTTRRHQINIFGPETLPVRADPTRLRQVLNNLVSNAIKYSPQGGQIEVRLRPNEADGTAIVYVRDHGIGVNPADVPKLFDRFSRVLSKDTLAIPGSGLGLYIAHHIMEAHGGSLSIQPAPGKGTIAEITLPLLVEAEEGGEAPDGEGKETRSRRRASSNGHRRKSAAGEPGPKEAEAALPEEGVVVYPTQTTDEHALSDVVVTSTIDLSDTLPAYRPLATYMPPNNDDNPSSLDGNGSLSEADAETAKEKETEPVT